MAILAPQGFQPSPEFLSFDKAAFGESGHINLIGATERGKTHFLLNLIALYQPDKVTAFVADTSQWSQYEGKANIEVYKGEWNGVTLPQIYKDTFGRWTNQKPRLEFVVFDDFSQKIDVNTDKLYKELFARARHFNIRCIVSAHTPTMAGQHVRANCACSVIFPGSNVEMARQCADYFLMGNNETMKRFFGTALNASKYAAIHIRDGVLNLIQAPPNNPIIQPMSTIQTGAMVNASQSRSAGRDYYDASHNSYNITANTFNDSRQQLLQSFELERLQLEQRREMARLAAKPDLELARIQADAELAELAMQPGLLTVNLSKVKHCLSYRLPRARLDILSVEDIGALVTRFMQQNGHPNYSMPNPQLDMITLGSQVVQSGPMSLVPYAIEKYAPSVLGWWAK